MERKYESKSVKSCVYVNCEGKEPGIVMPEDDTTMFNHLDGSVVLLNQEKEESKIIEIRPLLWTGHQDITGLDLYDYDKVKFNDTAEGVIHWIKDGFYVVNSVAKIITRLANCHNLVKTGNLLLDAEPRIVDAEIVEEEK